ncbi:MAG TPA: OmpA family protein [Myxococcota bacterium]|nr:OmpA family protein [Myxococcota bacterium]HRY92768.1 OmpA family protein [Myxococcota bacterium]HSA20437.1 OmpA family protein [Myxococcota bacterium]
MRRDGMMLGSAALALSLAFGGCVTSGTHEKVLMELDATKKELANTKDALSKEQQALKGEKDARAAEKAELDGKLLAALNQGRQLEENLASMSMKVGELKGEKSKLTDEQQALVAQVEELRKLRAAAEQRMADYRSLLEKLKKMMDAGTLQVKVRNGMMLVQMSSDVVFAPAATMIKAEAKDALVELAQTLASFTDRRFLVIGHSDSTPIRSARFPSNWELSTQRAVEVVKLLVESGVKPENISAAGWAEFDPLVGNDTPENRTVNRRVEIIFMPKIDELPGFEEVLKKGS